MKTKVRSIVILTLMSMLLLVVLGTSSALTDPVETSDCVFCDTGKPVDYDQTIRNFGQFRQKYRTPVEDMPASFDWRDYGIVNPAEDQGSCGSCWAFAATGVLESKMQMWWGPNAKWDLSEQQQISCNTDRNGCCGGQMKALRFWESRGPMYDSCTKYADRNTSTTSCPTITSNVSCASLGACYESLVRTTDYYTVDTSSIDDMKTSLYVDGPAYFRFNVYPDFSPWWHSASPGDVYRQVLWVDKPGGHAVLIIGWDDAKGAWLCQNSWGRNAGPNGDGTFWIAYRGHVDDLSFGMANTSLTMAPP